MSKYGFTLIATKKVLELSSTLNIWKHDATGGQLLSFINKDENKVFGVSFRTPPYDGTGVAHILEHSVLCGSDKYPVKEPFVALLKGSLQTFLNAFTYPDKTCYPVASANIKDFRNLTDVYLDAVFFPVISEQIFQQEGWHIEAENPNNGPFSYKGVVYNEMKGAFSSPESVMGRFCLHSLFPDTIYGLESGGDPVEIPNLTYEAFHNFHSKYYHPSNARFFFWGDDDEDERLEQLGNVLKKFEAISVDSSIGIQKHFTSPKSTIVPFAANEGDKGMAVVNWLGPDVMDVESVLAFRILDHILLGMPASPLRLALINSGIGEDIAGQGLEAELRQLTFDVGLKGIAPEQAPAMEQLILKTLEDLVEKGIPVESIEAAINSVEFILRENNTGRFPVGLSVMLRALTTWLYDGDPVAHIQFEQTLKKIKQKISLGEKYFEKIISKWFLENQHRVLVTLVPDANLALKQEQEENKKIELEISKLNEQQRQKLVEETLALQKWQAEPDSPEALSSIPQLSTRDLPKQNSSIPSSFLENISVPCMFHGLPTGGIVYAEAAFDLSGVRNDLIGLLPLFGRALFEMGTHKHDFISLNMEIAGKTGGMDADSIFFTQLTSSKTKGFLFLEGKTTPDKSVAMFSIMKEIINEVNFDQKNRFLQMVLEEKNRQEHSLIPAGHMVTATRLKKNFSISGALAEVTSGINQIQFLRSLAQKVEKDWESVLSMLKEIHSVVFLRENLTMNITALPDHESSLSRLVQSFAESLPEGKAISGMWQSDTSVAAEALILPAQVNYIGKAINLYDHGYQWHGSAQVVMKCLRTGYLWENVRVKGGAYGCVCGMERTNGGFFLVSYRDPSVSLTLDVYDATAEFLINHSFSNSEIDAAIVGAIGEVDTYLLPDAKGHTSFIRHLSENTNEKRQLLRDEILSTTRQHFIDFGNALMSLKNNGVICALGGNTLEKYAKENGWVITKIL